jgi:RNA exonuclease 1
MSHRCLHTATEEETVTSLDAQLTVLHAAHSLRTPFLIFSAHSDPRRMSALAVRRAEFHAKQDQNQRQSIGTSAAAFNAEMTSGGSSAAWWSMAGNRALEEAVMHGRMSLLFIGVETALGMHRRARNASCLPLHRGSWVYVISRQ